MFVFFMSLDLSVAEFVYDLFMNLLLQSYKQTTGFTLCKYDNKRANCVKTHYRIR